MGAIERTGIEVRDLAATDREAAVGVLARGMDDNPLHVAAYRGDADSRRRVHAALMRALFSASAQLHLVGAWHDGRLVGVAGSTPAGACRAGTRARARLLGTVLRAAPGAAARVVRWNAAWQRIDPDEPHVHLGPVAVDAGLRGRGIGGALLREHARRLDAIGAVGYLETDRPEAVPFYGRHGYAVVRSEDVLGVPCWFLRRPAVH